MPPEKSNNFSALLNLSRNLGGSFGISIAQALLNDRMQFHQSVLVSRLTASVELGRSPLYSA